ncbi:surfactant protein Ba [Epinephelus lanceolatus]|uniref:prosaposin isoform X2 n=1 Tax=Epinephelus lanceolatus TaxID=310571 RepID=UPI001444FB03|nr:prosaposin isoform X2 [Epinephelus lanceolatus]
MALFKTALLLFICLEGSALTSAFKVDGLQTIPDDLRATGDVCQDCTQIFTLLADMFSNADLQKKIMDGIENLCDHLPGPAAAKLCKDQVEKMLPMAIQFLTGIVKPADVCKILGLCGSCHKQEKMLHYFVKEALQVAVTSENVDPTTQCTFCIFLIKTLEDLLPKEMTEGAVVQLLEELCQILPPSYQVQCEAIIGKFSKTVIDAILGYATPQAICALIRLCKGQEAPLVDPCTLSAYRCRDMRTALKCGTMFYCQKYAWKPLNTLKYEV